MSSSIIYYSAAQSSDSIKNSAFLYGESVFTTTFIDNGKAYALSEHLERLKKGVNYLFGKTDEDFFKKIEVAILEVELNSSVNYLRITVYKDEKSLLQFALIFEQKLIDRTSLKLSSRLSSYRSGHPNFVKLGNYSYHFHAKGIAIKDGFDDVLFFDDAKNILELSTSNIFFIKGLEIFTPKLNEQILDGVCRQKIQAYCKLKRLNLIELDLKMTDLMQYEAAFATNSFLRGRSISSIDNHFFDIVKANNFLENFWNESENL